MKTLKLHVHISNHRKNGSSGNPVRIDSENHNLQEYTYKKITACDFCDKVLRGKQK